MATPSSAIDSNSDMSSTRVVETPAAAHGRLRTTFQSGKTQPVKWRRTQLLALQRFMKAAQSDILSALDEDMGRPAHESLSFSLLQFYADLDYLLRNLSHLTRPKPLGRQFLAPAYNVPTPKGAVAVLAPSNFPIFLAVRPVAAALAAGNTVLLKPTEFAPASEQFLLRLRDVLDPDAFAIVPGNAEVAQQICALPWDHIFFTGSPKVGRLIMAAAARHLTPVTLELGGKNPAVVLSDAVLSTAAKSIVRSRYFNCGQVCIATDYCLVEDSVYDAFLDTLQATVKDTYGEDPSTSPNYGRLSKRSFQHIESLLARTRGRVIIGGEKNEAENYVAPTVVATSLDDHLMVDEIFGPILPVIRVSSCSDAISEVNKRPHPLCFYLFTTADKKQVDDILRSTRSGSACVNDTLFQVAAPGAWLEGVGESGLGGGCGSDAGFHAFSHPRCVLKSTPTTARVFGHFINPDVANTRMGATLLHGAIGIGFIGKVHAVLAWFLSHGIASVDYIKNFFRRMASKKDRDSRKKNDGDEDGGAKN